MKRRCIGLAWLAAAAMSCALTSPHVYASELAVQTSIISATDMASRTERWIDGYIKQFPESFSGRLKRHLETLLLSEDSTEFLRGLVNRRALTGGQSLESYVEDYVHFISWQAIRRLPEVSVTAYMTTIEKLAAGRNEGVCREIRINRSTPQRSKPSELYEVLAKLPRGEQDQFFSLIELGFKRLSSGAYPRPVASRGELQRVEDEYLAFVTGLTSKSPTECSLLGITAKWIKGSIDGEASERLIRFSVWTDGRLPIQSK
jgi:hypothetical protein